MRAGRSEGILIIDPNLDFAEGMSRLLRLRGHRVEVAGSGPEGLEAAPATRPGVILLEVALPGLDGYEVASRLRAAAGFDGVLIVAVTGQGQESDRARSAAAGIDHHLLKPASLEEVLALVGDVAEGPGRPTPGG